MRDWGFQGVSLSVREGCEKSFGDSIAALDEDTQPCVRVEE